MNTVINYGTNVPLLGINRGVVGSGYTVSNYDHIRLYSPTKTGEIINEVGLNLQDMNQGDNSYGVRSYMTHATDRWLFYSKDRTARSLLGGHLGIINGSTDSTVPYPLTINASVGGISAWFSDNISATGYITRTSTFDTSKDPFDYIKSGDYFKNPDGTINHSKYYGYVEFEVPDESRPEEYIVETEIKAYWNLSRMIEESNNNTEVMEQMIRDNLTYDIVTIEERRTRYPYTKTEYGVDLVKEIDLIRESSYRLKVNATLEGQTSVEDLKVNGTIEGGSPLKIKGGMKLLPQNRNLVTCNIDAEGIFLYDQNDREYYGCRDKSGGAGTEFEWKKLS